MKFLTDETLPRSRQWRGVKAVKELPFKLKTSQMDTLKIDHKNGHISEYQLIKTSDGLPIAYHKGTSSELVQVLERLRINRTRVKLHYGDIETGRDWNEENDVTGRIGLSRGNEARFPILVHNERSYGGGSILDHCIVKIKAAAGGRVIWQAANYQAPQIKVIPSDMPEYAAALEINGTLYSRHKTERAAILLKNKLS